MGQSVNIYNPNIDNVELEEIIGLDTEFSSLDTLNANCSVISINNPIKGINYAFDVNGNIYTKEQIVLLIHKVEKCKIVLAHNAKVDIAIIKSNFGILLRNCWCTMLASQLIDNGYGYVIKKELLQNTEFANHPDKIYYTENMVGHIKYMPSPHGLHGCIKRYLNVDLKDTIDKKSLQRSFINLPKGREITKDQLDYACSDVTYLYPLYLEEMKYIEERNQKIQVLMENKLTPVIVKLEHKGSLIDVDLHKENIKNWEKKLFEIELQLDEYIRNLGKENESLRGGIYSNERKKEKVTQTALFDNCEKVIKNENNGNINYASSGQLLDIFKRCKEELPVDDEGKVSFGEEPIKFYITNFPESKLKDFLELILEFREYSKLLSTYGENLLTLLDNNNRMRTNYTQCFTNTGRLTSSAIIKDQLGLNLSNLPKRGDVRKIFIPNPGYSFVDSDMTGQELILVGGYSKEPVILKAFKEGFDHHSYFASISYSVIFNRKIEIKNKSEMIDIDSNEYDIKKLRDEHKNVIFARIYGGGPRRVQALLNKYLVKHIAPDLRFSTCEKISKELDKATPYLSKYLKSKVDEVKQNGFVETTMYGRRRYFDNPEKAFGDAMNYDIQSSGSIAIKIALINIDKFLVEKSRELNINEDDLGWIAMSIYDQNLICMNDKYIEFAPNIQKIMSSALTSLLKEDLIGSSDCNIRKWWSK